MPAGSPENAESSGGTRDADHRGFRGHAPDKRNTSAAAPERSDGVHDGVGACTMSKRLMMYAEHTKIIWQCLPEV